MPVLSAADRRYARLRKEAEAFRDAVHEGRFSEAFSRGERLIDQLLPAEAWEVLLNPSDPVGSAMTTAETALLLDRLVNDPPEGFEPWNRHLRFVFLDRLEWSEQAQLAAERLKDLPERYGWMRYDRGRTVRNHRWAFEEAIGEFDATVRAAPHFWKAEAAAAECYLCLGRNAEAFQAFERLIQRTRDRADRNEWQLAMGWRGELKLWVGQYAEAIEDLRAAGDRPLALVWRGAAHLMNGEAAAAMACLNRGIAGAPNDAEAYVWRAEAHARAKAWGPALKDAERAQKLDRGTFWAPLRRALVRAELGDDAGMWADFGQIPDRVRRAFEKKLAIDVGQDRGSALALMDAMVSAARGVRRSEDYLLPLWAPCPVLPSASASGTPLVPQKAGASGTATQRARTFRTTLGAGRLAEAFRIGEGLLDSALSTEGWGILINPIEGRASGSHARLLTEIDNDTAPEFAAWRDSLRPILLDRLGWREQALAAMVALTALPERFQWSRFRRAAMLRDAYWDFAAAAREFEAMHRTAPGFWQAGRACAECLLCLGRESEAFEALDRAIDGQRRWGTPEGAQAATLSRGEFLLWLGRYPEARDELTRAADERVPKALVWRGAARLLQGDTAALSDIDSGISGSSRDAEALLWRGQARSDAGESEGAIADFDEVERLRGPSPWVNILRPLARAHAGRAEEIWPDFDRIPRRSVRSFERKLGLAIGREPSRAVRVLEAMSRSARGLRRPESYFLPLWVPMPKLCDW